MNADGRRRNSRGPRRAAHLVVGRVRRSVRSHASRGTSSGHAPVVTPTDHGRMWCESDPQLRPPPRFIYYVFSVQQPPNQLNRELLRCTQRIAHQPPASYHLLHHFGVCGGPLVLPGVQCTRGACGAWPGRIYRPDTENDVFGAGLAFLALRSSGFGFWSVGVSRDCVRVVTPPSGTARVRVNGWL